MRQENNQVLDNFISEKKLYFDNRIESIKVNYLKKNMLKFTSVTFKQNFNLLFSSAEIQNHFFKP